MRLYDGDSLEWDLLPPDVYSRYEIMYHLLVRQVSIKAMRALEKF